MFNWILYKFEDTNNIPTKSDTADYAVILIGEVAPEKAIKVIIRMPGVEEINVETELTDEECQIVKNGNGLILRDAEAFCLRNYLIFQIIQNAVTKAGIVEPTLARQILPTIRFYRTIYDILRYSNPSTAAKSFFLMSLIPLARRTGNEKIVKLTADLTEILSFVISPIGYCTGKVLASFAGKIASRLLRHAKCDSQEYHDFIMLSLQMTAEQSAPAVAEFVEPYVAELAEQIFNAVKQSLKSPETIESIPDPIPTTLEVHEPPQISAKSIIDKAKNKAIEQGCKDHEEVIARETADIIAENRWGSDKNKWNNVLMEIWRHKLTEAYRRKHRHKHRHQHRDDRLRVEVSSIILETQANATAARLYEQYANNQPLTMEYQQELASIEIEQAIAAGFVFATIKTIASFFGKAMTVDQTSQIHQRMLTIMKEVDTSKQEKETIDLALPFLKEHCPGTSIENLKQKIGTNIALAHNFAKGAWAGLPNFRELQRIDSNVHHTIKSAGNELLKGLKRVKTEGVGVGASTDGSQHTMTIGTAYQPDLLPIYKSTKPGSAPTLFQIPKNPQKVDMAMQMQNPNSEASSLKESSPISSSFFPIAMESATTTTTTTSSQVPNEPINIIPMQIINSPPLQQQTVFIGTLPITSTTQNNSESNHHDINHAELAVEMVKVSSKVHLRFGNKIVGIIESGVSDFLQLANYHSQAKADPTNNSPKTTAATEFAFDAAIECIPYVGPIYQASRIITIVVPEPELPSHPTKQQLMTEGFWEGEARRELYQSQLNAKILFEVFTYPAKAFAKIQKLIVNPLKGYPEKSYPVELHPYSPPDSLKDANVICTDRECFTYTKKL